MTTTTNINNCIIFTNIIHDDCRGRFVEIYKHSHITDFHARQTNISMSKRGVLRGIHRTPYAKLVTCVKGQIYDVCVDLRTDSQTYLQYYGTILSEKNMKSLYIPPYCGHGFYVLEDATIVYNQGAEYCSLMDETYCYKSFKIEWPFIKELSLIISDKDSGACVS